ncbi:SRPBCC domain-containing protein [Fulvivirga sp. RKSG066]|uniref:SRPBCC family protein n=1 Tax=Fulvivirga aurantia TaxID=2529383 RepID=UPI0012BBCA5F|nr:SRPBCC domain-containing protein [Fulvivirga aurantia]MTI21461.1 SRPBCC domain-containing protein [Fulvivirga aurantia]
MSGWSTFTKKINVKADINQLYKAWATQSGIEKWFLRSAVYTKPDDNVRARDEYIQKGDKYLWHWHGFPDSVREEQEVISANGRDEIAFTFTGDCLVTVKLTRYNDQTIVSLTQSNIPEDNNPDTNLHIGCGEGWTFYLANLKSIIEGGIDLRNKSLDIQGVINS